MNYYFTFNVRMDDSREGMTHVCSDFIQQNVCSPEEETSSYRNVMRIYCGVCVFKTLGKVLFLTSDELHISTL